MVTILTDEIPPASVGVPYSFSLQAEGTGKDPLLWSIGAGGRLPKGLQLDAASGLIYGTPLQLCKISLYFIVTVAGSLERSGKILTVTVYTSALCITTEALPIGDVLHEYSCTLQCKGGHPPYTWTCNGLPGKLSLQKDTIQGMFSSECFCEIEVCVTDEKANYLHKNFRLTTSAPLRIMTDHLLCCLYDKKYSFTLECQGGRPPFHWEAKGLGPQMQLVGNMLQGRQNNDGIFSITVTDQLGQSASKDFNFCCLRFFTHLSDHMNFGPIKNNPVYGRLPPWVTVEGLPRGLSLINGMISGTAREGGFFYPRFYDGDYFLYQIEYYLNGKGI